MFMLVFPCFPVGGPHLFCPPTENQSVPSNEKPSVASKVWAHFLNSSPEHLPIKMGQKVMKPPRIQRWRRRRASVLASASYITLLMNST